MSLSPYTSIAAVTTQGTIAGAGFPVVTGAANVQVDILMNAPDIINPAGLTMAVYIDASYDGGLTWPETPGDVTWQSGPNSVGIGNNTPVGPGVAIGSTAPGGLLPANAQYRARVAVPQTLYFQAELTYFDASGNIL
jgi:hypothetical protein